MSTVVYRVTIKRDESFFMEHSDAHDYAKVLLGSDNTSPVIDVIVVLEKGWREKSALLAKLLEAT
jgi:hypothetical protein